MSIVSMTRGGWLSAPQKRCGFMLGNTYAPAAHRQRMDSRVWSQGEAGGGEGQPAAQTRPALALLLSIKLVVPEKHCWEICFLVWAGLEKADMLYYSFLSGSSTHVGVRENTQGPTNQ